MSVNDIISSQPNNFIPDAPTEWEFLGGVRVPNGPANERYAIHFVLQHIEQMQLSPKRRDRLKTAVGEATMNAMEHGNGYDSDQPAKISVWAAPDWVRVRITDRGRGIQDGDVIVPNATAKIHGQQTPRGWGVFLMNNMVDVVNHHYSEDGFSVDLHMYLPLPDLPLEAGPK